MEDLTMNRGRLAFGYSQQCSHDYRQLTELFGMMKGLLKSLQWVDPEKLWIITTGIQK